MGHPKWGQVILETAKLLAANLNGKIIWTKSSGIEIIKNEKITSPENYNKS